MNKTSVKTLVIDDSRTARFLVVSILNESAYEFDITEAIDGVDALGKIENSTYDLIITDVYMPDMDGVELVNELKNNFNSKAMILVLSSKAKMKNVFILSELIKPDEFLDKKYLRNDLLSLVERKLTGFHR